MLLQLAHLWVALMLTKRDPEKSDTSLKQAKMGDKDSTARRHSEKRCCDKGYKGSRELLMEIPFFLFSPIRLELLDDEISLSRYFQAGKTLQRTQRHRRTRFIKTCPAGHQWRYRRDTKPSIGIRNNSSSPVRVPKLHLWPVDDETRCVVLGFRRFGRLHKRTDSSVVHSSLPPGQGAPVYQHETKRPSSLLPAYTLMRKLSNGNHGNPGRKNCFATRAIVPGRFSGENFPSCRFHLTQPKIPRLLGNIFLFLMSRALYFFTSLRVP